MSEDRFQRPQTAQAAVLNEIRRLIVDREILPGAPIRQDDIAQRFGVSRVPVREALKILEAEGHIDHVPHYGFYASELTHEDLLEVYSIRELLEEFAIRRTAELATDEDLVRMEKCLDMIDAALESGDLSALTEANRAFHMSLLEPSRMPRLMGIVRNLWDALAPYRPVFFMADEDRKRLQIEHREIVTALGSRDAERAVNCLTHHRSSSVKALQHAVDAGFAVGDSSSMS